MMAPVEPIEAEQQGLPEPAETERSGNADDAASQGDAPQVAEDEPLNCAARGAERHANAQFAHARRHHVGKHAVQPDGGEQGRQTGERCGERGQHALGRHVRPNLLVHGP